MRIAYRGKIYEFYSEHDYKLACDYDGRDLVEFMENNCDYFEVLA